MTEDREQNMIATQEQGLAKPLFLHEEGVTERPKHLHGLSEEQVVDEGELIASDIEHFLSNSRRSTKLESILIQAERGILSKEQTGEIIHQLKELAIKIPTQIEQLKGAYKLFLSNEIVGALREQKSDSARAVSQRISESLSTIKNLLDDLESQDPVDRINRNISFLQRIISFLPETNKSSQAQRIGKAEISQEDTHFDVEEPDFLSGFDKLGNPSEKDNKEKRFLRRFKTFATVGAALLGVKLGTDAVSAASAQNVENNAISTSDTVRSLETPNSELDLALLTEKVADLFSLEVDLSELENVLSSLQNEIEQQQVAQAESNPEQLERPVLSLENITITEQDSPFLYRIFSAQANNTFFYTLDVIRGSSLAETRFVDASGVELSLSDLQISSGTNLEATIAALLLDIYASQPAGNIAVPQEIKFVGEKNPDEVSFRVSLSWEVTGDMNYTYPNGVQEVFIDNSSIIYIRHDGALQQQRLTLSESDGDSVRIERYIVDNEIRQLLMQMGVAPEFIPADGETVPLVVDQATGEPIRIFHPNVTEIVADSTELAAPEVQTEVPPMRVAAKESLTNLRVGPGTNFDDIGDLLPDGSALLNLPTGQLSTEAITATQVPSMPGNTTISEVITSRLDQLQGLSNYQLAPENGYYVVTVNNPNYPRWIAVSLNQEAPLSIENIAFVAESTVNLTQVEGTTTLQEAFQLPIITQAVTNEEIVRAALNQGQAVEVANTTTLPSGEEIADLSTALNLARTANLPSGVSPEAVEIANNAIVAHYQYDGPGVYRYRWENGNWVDLHPGRDRAESLLPPSFFTEVLPANNMTWDKDLMVYRYENGDIFMRGMGIEEINGSYDAADFRDGRSHIVEEVSTADFEEGVEGLRISWAISNEKQDIHSFMVNPNVSNGSQLRQLIAENFNNLYPDELHGMTIVVSLLSEYPPSQFDREDGIDVFSTNSLASGYDIVDSDTIHLRVALNMDPATSSFPDGFNNPYFDRQILYATILALDEALNGRERNPVNTIEVATKIDTFYSGNLQTILGDQRLFVRTS